MLWTDERKSEHDDIKSYNKFKQVQILHNPNLSADKKSNSWSKEKDATFLI
jgi:hypothetical protein